jgi:two-component system cell cycle sensor histidine kinase/response regulator CckA
VSIRHKTLLIVIVTLAAALGILAAGARVPALKEHGNRAYPVLASVGAGVAFGVVGLALALERMVLARLAHLSQSVTAIGARRDLSARVELHGNDELFRLAGEINRMLAALQRSHDENQLARSELQDSEELLRSVVENMPIGIWVTGRDFRVRLWNAGLEAMTGVPRSQVLGQDIFARFPSLTAAGLEDLSRRVIDTSEPLVLNDHPLSDPTMPAANYRLNVRANPLKDATGRVTGIVVALEDISDRKRTEEALARSRDFYLTLFDEFPTPIRRTNAQGECDFTNKSWLSLTGCTRQEALGHGWLQAVHPEDRERVRQAAREAFAGREPFELEYRLRHHDGEYRWFITIERPFQDLDGSFAGYLASCYDVTERKRLEDQFRQAQKMEAIGRLAGGLAHDFNNLLTAITGYASFVRDALPAGDPVREDVTQVLSAAERGADLTRQLLAFSRRQPIKPSIANLNEIILNLSKMLRRLIGDDIELVTVPALDLDAVEVDAGQIEQVLVNLVVNAGDAMPEGGRLTIETANVTLDAAYARQHVSVRPGQYVMLAVSDTGCGMTEEVKARIFEPFFTTKAAGKGTGLGLATCYGIVKQNGGHIWFYSEPGKGTTFKMYFPRIDMSAAEPQENEGESPRARDSETILLVEDDLPVRRFAARVLREAGYTVLEAASGQEALELAASRDGSPIHLLVTDLVMRQMAGDELARTLKAMHPELRALFVSGYTAQSLVRNGDLAETASFLQKPFTMATLTRKVHEVLHG